MIEAAGGKLHHAFISLGSLDVLVIAELPDDASVAAVTLAVGAASADGPRASLVSFRRTRSARHFAPATKSAKGPNCVKTRGC